MQAYTVSVIQARICQVLVLTVFCIVFTKIGLPVSSPRLLSFLYFFFYFFFYQQICHLLHFCYRRFLRPIFVFKTKLLSNNFFRSPAHGGVTAEAEMSLLWWKSVRIQSSEDFLLKAWYMLRCFIYHRHSLQVLLKHKVTYVMVSESDFNCDCIFKGLPCHDRAIDSRDLRVLQLQNVVVAKCMLAATNTATNSDIRLHTCTLQRQLDFCSGTNRRQFCRDKINFTVIKSTLQ